MTNSRDTNGDDDRDIWFAVIKLAYRDLVDPKSREDYLSACEFFLEEGIVFVCTYLNAHHGAVQLNAEAFKDMAQRLIDAKQR